MLVNVNNLYRSAWVEEDVSFEAYKKFGYDNILRNNLMFMPHVSFVCEYKFLGRKIDITASDYYRFYSMWDETGKHAEFKCNNLMDLVDSFLKQRYDYNNNIISLWGITDKLYEIRDGHHRCAVLYAFGSTEIECEIYNKITQVWNLPKQKVDLIHDYYDGFYEQFKDKNLSYQPIWWDSYDRDIKCIRDDSYKRFCAIIEDIYNSNMGGDKLRVLEVGSNMGYYASALSQFEQMDVYALENHILWFDFLKMRQEYTGLPKNLIFGDVNKVEEEFDIIIYLHTFHNSVEFESPSEANNQFEKICEMTKKKIYLSLGNYNILNPNKMLSGYQKDILLKHGFNHVKLMYYDGVNDFNNTYAIPMYVASRG